MDSILNSVKKALGIAADQTHFDSVLLANINSVFTILTQLGVGPAEGFSITDEYTTWDMFIQNSQNIESVRTYMNMKVKLLFDPPLSATHMEAMNRMISEFEFRLNVAVESVSSDSEEESQNGK